MNNDLISRKALLKRFEELKENPNNKLIDTVFLDGAQSVIDAAPAVDAEPIRHGKYGWVGMDMLAGTRSFYYGTCSECKERINFAYEHKNYCPNCGAKLDKEK